jgi:NACalpha-BTF3-like transcription factor
MRKNGVSCQNNSKKQPKFNLEVQRPDILFWKKSSKQSGKTVQRKKLNKKDVSLFFQRTGVP